MGEIIGYKRVSDEKQNLARQDELFESLGIKTVFSEKQSGKNADRPELKRLLEYVRTGDIVVVESISRLARNIRDLLRIVDELNSKGAKFMSMKENIDTTTSTGEFMLTVFGALAELERKSILERQREGIEIAKKEGKYKGRKPVTVKNFDVVYLNWKEGKITGRDAAKMLGVGISTFYRRVKEKN